MTYVSLSVTLYLADRFMRSLNPWPIFPTNLEPPVARSLSLQFIMQELIASFQLVHQLQSSAPHQFQGIYLSQQIGVLSTELEKLLLFSLGNPFSQKGGSLDKLCFYCEILLQASNVKDQDIPRILEEMRNAILRAKSQMVSWKKSPIPLNEFLSSLLGLYSDLHLKLCRFFSSLTLFLQEARSDENVLLYLIEHKQQFNSFIGARTIEDLLHRFFPAGHAQLRAVICEGYTRRGFSAFFIETEPLINSIEWETPCLSQR